MVSPEVLSALNRRKSELEQAIAKLRRELEPLEDEYSTIERVIKTYTAGSIGSGNVTDDEITSYVRRNGQKDSPLSTRDIAQGLGVDARGIAKRLPRMVRQGHLSGDPSGYYVEARTRSKTREHA